MENINIFKSGSQPQRGEFFKFAEIGDEIQGTYIDLQTGVDSYGNQQNIYVLKASDGKIWSVGVRLQNTILISDIDKRAKYGQIIGFRYDRSVPSKKMPGKYAKVINLYADPRCIDKAWMEEQKKLDMEYGVTQGPEEISNNEFATPQAATPLETNMPAPAKKQKNDAIEAIRNLAKTKGLTGDSMSALEADTAIEKYTGLELSEANLTKIIIALTGYVKR